MEPLQIGELEERRRNRLFGLLALAGAVIVGAVAPFLLEGQNGLTVAFGGAAGLGSAAVVGLSKSISASRPWARRAFWLLFLPLFAVPAFSLWLSMAPLDPSAPLVERELPGMKISLLAREVS
jgi:hypothetical protein